MRGYVNPLENALLSPGENGHLNARSAMIGGGAADGLAQLAQALVMAPAMRRQLEEKRAEQQFQHGLETRAADRSDRQQQLLEAFHNETLADKKAGIGRQGKRDYMDAENKAVEADERGRHNRALEEALVKKADAAAKAKALPLHEAQTDPYTTEQVPDNYGRMHPTRRLKTADEIKSEIGIRKQLRDALGGGGAPAAPEEGATPQSILDQLDSLGVHHQDAAPVTDEEAGETAPDNEEQEATPVANAPASAPAIPAHLQAAEADPAWRAHLDKKFPNRKTDPAQAKAASDYVAANGL